MNTLLIIILVYFVIGWLLAGWKLAVALWRNSLYDDDEARALILAAYWLPMLLFIVTAYGAWGCKLLCKCLIIKIKQLIQWYNSRKQHEN